jgi:hypothetical protein
MELSRIDSIPALSARDRSSVYYKNGTGCKSIAVRAPARQLADVRCDKLAITRARYPVAG